ncbi:MAG: diacylglycerol kinase family lipid kinase [Chloroflexi bacterium]|nr:diacylglycerol kinase family lipid kinase [Chloroflexota bacterium]
MRRARLILNPIPWARRAWSNLPETVNLLEDAGIRVDLAFTKMTEAMTQSVAQAVQEDYDLVIAGGGDGTVSEVASGLVGTGVPLGILPFGTYNNVAHSLGVPLDLAAASRAIAEGKTIDIDVGVANGNYFFEAVGVGLDASLFPIGEEIKGGHYEKVLQGAMKFLRQRKAEMTLILDGEELNLRSPMAVVANGPYYGAGFTIAPQASLTDGMLEVVIFECSMVEVARHFALSAQNRVHEEPCVTVHRSREVKVLSRLPLPAHADGRPIGNAPVACSVLPGALRVIVP